MSVLTPMLLRGLTGPARRLLVPRAQVHSKPPREQLGTMVRSGPGRGFRGAGSGPAGSGALHLGGPETRSESAALGVLEGAALGRQSFSQPQDLGSHRPSQSCRLFAEQRRAGFFV